MPQKNLRGHKNNRSVSFLFLLHFYFHQFSFVFTQCSSAGIKFEEETMVLDE